MITELCERFGVKIDLDKDNGGVKIRGANAASAISQYAANQELEGVVVKIVEFGLFVELPDGSQGLIHISKVGAGGKRIAKLSDHFKEGDRIVVIFEGQDERKKIALNLRDKIAP